MYSVLRSRYATQHRFLKTAKTYFMGFNFGWWEGEEEGKSHDLPADYQLGSI